MAAKKRPVTQEPLLNAVARKLGHAAGTLTKVTHQFTENLSALPESLTTKVRKAANVENPTGRPRLKKGVSRAASKGHEKNVAGGNKAEPRITKSPRSSRRRARSGK